MDPTREALKQGVVPDWPLGSSTRGRRSTRGFSLRGALKTGRCSNSIIRTRRESQCLRMRDLLHCALIVVMTQDTRLNYYLV